MINNFYIVVVVRIVILHIHHIGTKVFKLTEKGSATNCKLEMYLN